MEGCKPLADPVPSIEPAPPSDGLSAEAMPVPEPGVQAMDSEAVPHARHHVTSQQSDDDGVERFVNTKLNVALINDPLSLIHI